MKKILIIEDEVAIRKVMRDMLSDAGFTVIEAKDGQEGLEIALKEHPNVILLDLLMPNMDGQTMLKKLRKDSWGEQVKVIILSNQDDAESIGKSYFDGNVTEYIIKSNVSLSELTKKVKKAVTIAS